MEIDVEDIKTWDLDRCVNVRWALRRTAKANDTLALVMKALNNRIKELGAL